MDAKYYSYVCSPFTAIRAKSLTDMETHFQETNHFSQAIHSIHINPVLYYITVIDAFRLERRNPQCQGRPFKMACQMSNCAKIVCAT